MATFHAIAGAGKTLERLLNACFAADEPVDGETTRAALVQAESFDLNAAEEPSLPALSIFLHRVSVNPVMRAGWSAVGSLDGRGHLPLDLHFLLTPWGTDAEMAHLVLGKTMECLEAMPIVTGPVLYSAPTWSTEPIWTAGEALQVTPDELSQDQVVSLFDALEQPYRLSASYLARVVRLDTRETPSAPEVATAVAGIVPSSMEPIA